MVTRLIIVALAALVGADVTLAGGPAENSLGMRFLPIPSGSFLMGTEDPDGAIWEMPEPKTEAIADEIPAHRVTLTRGFLFGETEVTQGYWYKVMGTKPGPSAYWSRDDWEILPVVSVSWLDARVFIDKLSQKDPVYDYRLPTEAEWEYAARAATRGIRPVSETELIEHAWFIENSGDHPHPVATRRPNAWGLYDMLGNAWEWTADWYGRDTYQQGERIDPTGSTSGRSRVRRGGSYHCPRWQTRPGYRQANVPDTRYSVLGFRLVAEPAE